MRTQVTEDDNKQIMENFAVSDRPRTNLTKVFKPAFTKKEFDALVGILLITGAHGN